MDKIIVKCISSSSRLTLGKEYTAYSHNRPCSLLTEDEWLNMTQEDLLQGKISQQDMTCLVDEIINANVSLIALHNVMQSSHKEPATEELLEAIESLKG